MFEKILKELRDAGGFVSLLPFLALGVMIYIAPAVNWGVVR